MSINEVDDTTSGWGQCNAIKIERNPGLHSALEQKKNNSLNFGKTHQERVMNKN